MRKLTNSLLLLQMFVLCINNKTNNMALSMTYRWISYLFRSTSRYYECMLNVIQHIDVNIVFNNNGKLSCKISFNIALTTISKSYLILLHSNSLFKVSVCCCCSSYQYKLRTQPWNSKCTLTQSFLKWNFDCSQIKGRHRSQKIVNNR